MSKILASILALFLLAGATLTAADKKSATSDDAIHDQVMNKLASDPIAKGGSLKVDVANGVVTLSGPVANERQRDKAIKVAKKVKGVKDVVSNLSIQARPSGK